MCSMMKPATHALGQSEDFWIIDEWPWAPVPTAEGTSAVSANIVAVELLNRWEPFRGTRIMHTRRLNSLPANTWRPVVRSLLLADSNRATYAMETVSSSSSSPPSTACLSNDPITYSFPTGESVPPPRARLSLSKIWPRTSSRTRPAANKSSALL